jgi:thiol:disulfide interchange protein
MRLLLALLFSLSFITASFAQINNPVKWTMESKQVSADEFDLIYSATIEEGWTVYSQYLESDDGPVATSFTYDEGAHFELVGKSKESDNRVKKYDKVFEMDLIKFFNSAVFTQRVKINDFSKPITGYFTFMTCDAKKCLAPSDIDFNFALKNTMTSAGGEKKKKEETPEPKKEAPTPEKTPQGKGDLSLSSDSNNGAGGRNQNQNTSANTTAKIPSTISEPIAQNETIEIAPIDDAQADSSLKKTTTWKVTLEKVNNSEYNLVLVAQILDNWYLYSQFQDNQDSDEYDGPYPTAFNYDPGENYELVGKTTESDNMKRVRDAVFEMDVNKFSHDATFTQKIKITDPSKPVTAYFEYQTCDDKQCIMNTDDIFIDVKNGKVYIGTEATKMMSTSSITGTSADGGQSHMSGDTIDQTRTAIVDTFDDPAGNCGGETESGSGWIWTFILGFGGGLIALLTPCVFPMIPLTVSFFTKGSKTRAEGIKNGLIYGASIIVIYVALGLLITFLFGPEALNRLSTHWLPNLLFFVIFIIFAISFFGYFEITLPSSWTTKTDSMADQGGLLGTFFMAATLSLVSFSCTGPIIGSALVESASDPIGPFTVMLGFSTALALPFGLFAAFPAWLNSLPQSGGWMTNVKVILGFLEVALAFKFLSVADYTFHWGILKYELFLAIWVIVAICMALYMLGYILFPHDAPLKKITPLRGILAAVFLGTAIFLAMGFKYNDVTKSYNSPSLLSGLAPPSNYNFFLPTPEMDADLKKRFPSFTKCANNLDCFKDYYEGLAYAQETNQPLLVDFTGYGCVNCRKTEDNVWIKYPVRDNIEKNFVLVSLYVDSPDKLEKTLFSKAQSKKLRNVGNKWADFQIANFRNNAQPLYVLMTPDEQVLARPVGYLDGWSNWEEYNDYLNCGLQTYEGVKNGTLGMKSK